MKLLLACLSLISFSSIAADIKINVKNSDPDFKLNQASVVYQSTSDSFFCTEGSFSDGSYNRHRKIYDVEISGKRAGNTVSYVIPENKGDRCKSTVVGMEIKVSHPMLFSNSRIEFEDVDGATARLDQEIVYKHYDSPIGGKYISSGDKIKLGKDLEANVEIVIE